MIKCQVSSFPYLRCREAGLFLCSSHRFGLIAPSEGYKRANGKAKLTGAERSAVPGDGRQPQANKYNKQRSFYSRRLFPKQKEMKSTTWELDQLMLGWQNSSYISRGRCYFDVQSKTTPWLTPHPSNPAERQGEWLINLYQYQSTIFHKSSQLLAFWKVLFLFWVVHIWYLQRQRQDKLHCWEFWEHSCKPPGSELYFSWFLSKTLLHGLN